MVRDNLEYHAEMATTWNAAISVIQSRGHLEHMSSAQMRRLIKFQVMSDSHSMCREYCAESAAHVTHACSIPGAREKSVLQ